MSSISLKVTTNKDDKFEITIDKNHLSIDYLKKEICSNLKIKNQSQINSIIYNHNGKEIIIDDDMSANILFNKIENESFKKKQLFVKYDEEIINDSERITTLSNKNIPKKDFEDVIDYLLINMKETIMNEMKEKINEEQLIYRGHKCNKCGNHIIGHLYQCSECENDDNSFYLLCNNCIEKNLKEPFHNHKFYIL